MAFPQWTIDQANSQVALDATAPPEGNGCLLMQCGLSVAAASLFVSPTVGGLPTGLTAGRYRTIMRMVTAAANSADTVAGFVLLGSALTIRTVSGSFYTVVKNGNAIQLRRGNATTLASGAGTVLTSGVHTVTTNVNFTVQIDWTVGGTSTDFIVATGTALDFSDLAQLFTFQDSSGSRLTTSVIEGLYVKRESTPVASVVIDNLQLIL